MHAGERKAGVQGGNLHHNTNQTAQQAPHKGLKCLAESIISELLFTFCIFGE